MSRERIELRRLAAIERARAWHPAKRLPGRTGDAIRAFAKTHPGWAMGAAAALALGFTAKRARRATGTSSNTASSGGDERGSAVGSTNHSLTMALAAAGVQVLPQLLELAGLTVTEPPQPQSDDKVRADDV